MAVWGISSATRASIKAASEAPGELLSEIRDAVISGNGGGIDEQGARIINQSGDTLRKVADEIDKRVAERANLTVEEELNIGRQYHEEVIAKRYRILTAPRAEKALATLIDPIVKHTIRKGPNYRVYILESDELNAFSVAGGYIYVTTALLKFLKSDAEIQFTLGHEVAHIELQHVTRIWSHIKWSGSVFGEANSQVVMAAYGIFRCMYDQDNEFACDKWAFETLRKCGRTKAQLLAAPKRFLEWAAAESIEPHEHQQPDTIADALINEIENHFRSHPLWAERVQRLEAMK